MLIIINNITVEQFKYKEFFMQSLMSGSVSFQTRTIPTAPEPLNIRWKLVQELFNKPISVGWPIVIHGVPSIVAFAKSHFFKLISKWNPFYENMIHIYDFKCKYGLSPLCEIVGKIIFENKLELTTVNISKQFPGDQEIELVKILMKGYPSKNNLECKSFYEKIKNGICSGYVVFIFHLVKQKGVSSAIDLLKKMDLGRGAPLEAATYQFVFKESSSAQKRRMHLIENILNNEITLPDQCVEFDLIRSLNNREKLLLEFLIINKTKYSYPYQGRRSIEEIRKELIGTKDFYGLVASNYDKSTISFYRLSEEEIKIFNKIDSISLIISHYICMQVPWSEKPFEKLYFRLEELENYHIKEKPCIIKSEIWYASRARIAYQFIKKNTLGLTKRECLAIRYALSRRYSVYKEIESKKIDELASELFGQEDYVSNGMKIFFRMDGKKTPSDSELDKIELLCRRLDTILNFIQDYNTEYGDKKVYDVLKKNFSVVFPEQERYSFTRSECPIFNHLGINSLEWITVNTKDFKEIDGLSDGIWWISFSNDSIGHAMAYIKMGEASFLFDPNIGFISLEPDSRDHKIQIIKLYKLYNEEIGLNNFYISLVNFNDKTVSVEDIID